MLSQPDKNINQFHVDPGMVVADLGAGTGHYTIPLAERVGPSGKVYAIDIQKDLLSKLQSEAKEKGVDNITLVWGDLDEVGGTTLKESSVDRAVIANTFFQIEDKDVFMKEVHRILKTKGLLLLVEWKDSFGGIGPHHEHVVKSDVARTLFEDAGFVLEKEINVGDYQYGMIFKEI
jgi:ubiquinone/menaquinone biosynthesis C-methylase UbiE